jgi:hypothetical protein
MPNWSWRTTAVGILGAIGILAGQASAALDSNPATIVSFSEIFAALSVLGLGLIARDDSVTSEQAGAK